jgi:metal-responsive CopG/Arc/MetJ family transcriptional regulator
MRRVSLFLPEKLLEGLERLKDEHGTPQAESVRRAIAAYLTDKGMTPKPAKQKAAKRQRKK